MKQKNIQMNMFLNTIKGIMSILFPLISFPYVSRILGAANLGKYNFSMTFISYFLLFANLGIVPYSIREGAKIRNEKEKLDKFASEMFTINFFSSIVSIIVLIVVLLTVNRLDAYRNLILILSLQIPMNLIGVEWIFSIFENYLYITVRSILFQIVSLILLFVFVRGAHALVWYSGITIISNVGANIFNWFNSRKYCRIKFSSVDWKKHYKPIVVLFAMCVTGTIYSSTDITILGFMCSDETVGYYSLSVKIYSIIKTVIASIVIVSIPRLSSLIYDKDNFKKTAREVYSTLITFVFPAIVGILSLKKEIILIVASDKYTNSVSSLMILSIALFFALGSYYWGQSILIPQGKDKFVFKITFICAIVNLFFNILLIPMWKENAAAFTTLIAEGISYYMYRKEGNQYVEYKVKIDGLKVIQGCVWIIFVNVGLKLIINNFIMRAFLSVIISGMGYVVVEYYLKNQVVVKMILDLKKKLKCKR